MISRVERRRGSSVSFPDVSVRNLQHKIGIDVAELRNFAPKAVRHCLALRKRKGTDLLNLSELFIWLISDRRMALLHRKFLGKSGPTDVITFQHGEIFISIETARRHVHAFGNSLLEEVKLYMVHGLLHLHGFDHRTRRAADVMKAAERKILRMCNGAR
jgi:probable rRNA maturation factor